MSERPLLWNLDPNSTIPVTKSSFCSWRKTSHGPVQRASAWPWKEWERQEARGWEEKGSPATPWALPQIKPCVPDIYDVPAFSQTDLPPCREWGPALWTPARACSGGLGGWAQSPGWGQQALVLGWKAVGNLQPWLGLGIRTWFSTPPCQGPSVIILDTPVESALRVCEELADRGQFHGALGVWASSKEGDGCGLLVPGSWAGPGATCQMENTPRPRFLSHSPPPLASGEDCGVNPVCSTHLKGQQPSCLNSDHPRGDWNQAKLMRN